MVTIYDLVTLTLFAGLAVLFLQRSVGPPTGDRIYQYIPPAVGCAVANWLGNQKLDAFAIGTLVISVAYVFIVLKPLRHEP
jgi:hypothetical protein